MFAWHESFEFAGNHHASLLCITYCKSWYTLWKLQSIFVVSRDVRSDIFHQLCWYFLGCQRSPAHSKHVAWNGTVSNVNSLIIFFKTKMLNFRNKFSYIRVVVLRYLRLTPSLAFTILLMQLLSIAVRNRPLCAEVYCEKNWWKTISHIQNYVNPEKMVRMWKIKLFELGVVKNIFLVPASLLLSFNWYANDHCRHMCDISGFEG